jgi:hypothetical protein
MLIGHCTSLLNGLWNGHTNIGFRYLHNSMEIKLFLNSESEYAWHLVLYYVLISVFAHQFFCVFLLVDFIICRFFKKINTKLFVPFKANVSCQFCSYISLFTQIINFADTSVINVSIIRIDTDCAFPPQMSWTCAYCTHRYFFETAFLSMFTFKAMFSFSFLNNYVTIF